MREALLTISFLAITATAAGCDDGEAGAAKPGAGAPASVSDPDAVRAAWRDAGMTVSTFDAADGARYGDGDCTAGQVNGVDVVLCEYASPELAAAAEAAGLAAVGTTTGASIASGRLLLVVADRRKADPEGRTINQALKLFRGR